MHMYNMYMHMCMYASTRAEPTTIRELAYFRDALSMRALFVCEQAFASLPRDVVAQVGR